MYNFFTEKIIASNTFLASKLLFPPSLRLVNFLLDFYFTTIKFNKKLLTDYYSIYVRHI
jgi:hypothetical protein